MKDRFVAPDVIARRTTPPQMLTCYCCGDVYRKGQFRCCAAPLNLPSHVWLAKHCRKCADDPTGLRSKCPKHCTCPTETVLGVDGFSAFRDTSLAAELERKRNLFFDAPTAPRPEDI